MDIADKVSKGAVVVYIERLVATAVGFVFPVLLVRILSTTDYGVYKLVKSILVFVMYIASFGLESIVSRFVADFRANQQNRNVNTLIFLALFVRVTAILIVLAGFFLFGDKIGDIINARIIFEDLFGLVVFYIAFSLINNVLGRSLLTGYSQRHLVGYVTIATQLLTVAMIGVVAITNKGLYSVISVLLLASLFEFLIYLPLCVSKIIRNVKLNVRTDNPSSQKSNPFPFRRVIRFGSYNYFWQGGQVFREYSVDNFVISYFRNIAAVAFYGIATVMPQFLRGFSPTRIMYGVLLPPMVKRYTISKSYDDVALWYVLLQKTNLIFMLPVVAFFITFAGELIQFLYGSIYSASLSAAMILVGFSIVQSASDPFYLISQVIERPSIIFYTSVWGLYNLVMDFALIPLLGIEGAAIATGTTAVFIFLHFSLAYKYAYRIDLHFPWGSGVKTLVNMIPPILCFVVVKKFDLPNVFDLALFSLAALSYLGMCSVNKIFDEQERNILLARFKFMKYF